MIKNVYVGWDSREDIAYRVAKHSIREHNDNINIIPIKQHEMRERNLYWREIDKLASTEFTFTRFLVPYLNNFEGWALFVDCDFLFRIDPEEIFAQADDRYAVMCAQHDYKVEDGSVKMDGKVQHAYPRKNWSSMMLINCGHPFAQKLSLNNVNHQSGAWLHRFEWCDDKYVGQLSHEYNWLVGVYKEPQDGSPKVLHYTEGCPFMPGYEDSEYAEEWFDMQDKYYKSYD